MSVNCWNIHCCRTQASPEKLHFYELYHLWGHISPKAGSTDLRKDTPLLVAFFLTDDSRKVESETVDDWKSDWMLQDIKEYDFCDTHNADNTGLFLSVQASKNFTSHGDPATIEQK